MILINDLINKIKWDDRENPDEYELEYLDLNKLVKIAYTDIQKIDGSFMVLRIDGKETYVPLHRIKIVRKNGKIIWQRTIKK